MFHAIGAPKIVIDAETAAIDLLSLTVGGKPRAKARPRFSFRGRVHNPRTESLASQSFKTAVREMLALEPDSNPPFGSAHIKVTIVATFARPKGHYKQGGEGELRVSAPRTPIGDVDNLLKFVLDTLNKVLFDDDKQVVYAAVSKEYTSVSRTYIQIERIN